MCIEKESPVTVIVPAYNVEKYIDRCIASIINQTYKDIEIILIDDGSTDNTKSIIEKWVNKDNRIHLYSISNGGVSVARRLGLEKATGRYVCFVDADDSIEATMIEKMYSNIQNVDVVSVGVFEERADASIVPYYDAFDEGIITDLKIVFDKFLYDSDMQLLHPVSPWIWNKMYRTDIAREVYDNTMDILSFAEDTYFVCAYLLKSNSIYILKEPLYNYSYRSDSAAHQYDIDAIVKLHRTYKAFCNLISGVGYDTLKKQVDVWYHNNVLKIMYGRMDLDNTIKKVGFLPQMNFVKINLYAAGVAGRWLYEYYSRIGVEVVKWVDKKYKELDNPIVVSTEAIVENEYPVVIAVTNYELYINIKTELVAKGIDSKRIVWGCQNGM